MGPGAGGRAEEIAGTALQAAEAGETAAMLVSVFAPAPDDEHEAEQEAVARLYRAIGITVHLPVPDYAHMLRPESPCWSCGTPAAGTDAYGGGHDWACAECEVSWADYGDPGMTAWTRTEMLATGCTELVDFGRPDAIGSPA